MKQYLKNNHMKINGVKTISQKTTNISMKIQQNNKIHHKIRGQKNIMRIKIIKAIDEKRINLSNLIIRKLK